MRPYWRTIASQNTDRPTSCSSELRITATLWTTQPKTARWGQRDKSLKALGDGQTLTAFQTDYDRFSFSRRELDFTKTLRSHRTDYRVNKRNRIGYRNCEKFP